MTLIAVIWVKIALVDYKLRKHELQEIQKGRRQLRMKKVGECQIIVFVGRGIVR